MNTVASLPAWREKVEDMLRRLETMQPPNVILQQITMLGEARDLLREALASPAPSAGVDEALREAAEEALGLLETLDPLHGITTQLRTALQHPAAPSVEATPNPLARYWMNRAEFWMQTAISLGWREVRDAANGEAPSVSPAVAGDAGELPEACDLLRKELQAIARELRFRMAGPASSQRVSGAELIDWALAVDEIAMRLATAEQPGSAVQGEAVAWKSPFGSCVCNGDNACPGCNPNAAIELAREIATADERRKHAPCMECGANSPEEAQGKCVCGGDKDDCHGCELWPEGDTTPPPAPAAERDHTDLVSQKYQGPPNLDVPTWIDDENTPALAPAAEQGLNLPDTLEQFVAEQRTAPSLPLDGMLDIQPEARGVEGMVDRMIARYLELEPGEAENGVTVDHPETRAFCRELLLAASPNPVRAEQPEDRVSSQHIGNLMEFARNAPRTDRDTPEPPDAFTRAEQPVGKWKLVPVEPTEAMLASAIEVKRPIVQTGPNMHIGTIWSAEIYAAMLASAPAAPGAAVGVDEAMVERAAYALYELCNGYIPGSAWNRCCDSEKGWYRKQARAALTAALAGKDGA